MKSHLKLASRLALVLALSSCGPGDDANNGGAGGGAGNPGSAAPTVLSTVPSNDSAAIALNGSITATFSEPMDPASLNTNTFKVTTGMPATPVPGTVIYASSKAAFWPAAHLNSSSTYTVTVTTGARNASGTGLAADKTWRFTTGNSVTPGVPVNLGTAGNFVILAKSGVSTVPTSAVTGDIAVSPAAASYITGFSLTADSTNTFASSPQITGNVYAADYASPTPSNLTTAVSDMELAFTDAAGRAPDFTELGAGNIGGLTLAAGVYKWGTGVLIPTDVTLTGSATDVFVFQVAQDLTVANATRVTLAGGVLAKNVFWQVAGSVQIGTTAHVEGILLTQTSATLRTGASLKGRLLAQTAVEIDSATVSQP